jgi:hypothetical protein
LQIGLKDTKLDESVFNAVRRFIQKLASRPAPPQFITTLPPRCHDRTG